jgi:hypothetical protein
MFLEVAEHGADGCGFFMLATIRTVSPQWMQVFSSMPNTRLCVAPNSSRGASPRGCAARRPR